MEHTLGNTIQIKPKFYSSYSSKSVNNTFSQVACDPIKKKKLAQK